MKKLLPLLLTLFSLAATAQVQFGNASLFRLRDSVITGQAAQTATVNNILLATAGASALDVAGFRSVSVQVVSTGTAGTFIFEGSNDGTNFAAVPVYNQAVLTGTPISAAVTATASQIIYVAPLNFRYMRLRIATTITGGSIQAFCKLQITAFTPAVFQVANATAANLVVTAQPGNTANTTAWLMEQRTGTTNGSTSSTVNAAASTNATNLKATAGMIYAVTVMNASAATKYFRIYNLATAPTVGTSIPVIVIAVPATSSKEIQFSTGLKMATGIAYAITGGAAATDATAVAAGDVQALINWQ